MLMLPCRVNVLSSGAACCSCLADGLACVSQRQSVCSFLPEQQPISAVYVQLHDTLDTTLTWADSSVILEIWSYPG